MSLLMWLVMMLAVMVMVPSSIHASTTVQIDPERLGTFIELATSYIVRVSHTSEQDPNNVGKFTYIANLDDPLEQDFETNPQEEYNLLRHNGAIYSLSLTYDRTPSEDVLDAMKRSVDYLKKFAIRPVPDVRNVESSEVASFKTIEDFETQYNDLLAAWELPTISPELTKPVAKLGGAGLALIALVSLEKLVPGQSMPLQDLRKLGNFIKFLQHDDGSFTCRFRPTHGGRDDSWVSLYYPGEASLGLIYLASVETDEDLKEQWLVVATKALMYLEALRRTQELHEVEPDHWALLATAQLLPQLNDRSVEYELVYQHGLKVVRSMLSGHSKQELLDNGGCFSKDTRTCPTATRLEGLIASLSFVKDFEVIVGKGEDFVQNLRERMLEDISVGINFMLESQDHSRDKQMHGGVPVKFPTEEYDDKEVRVDYVQHSMSAVIAYEQLLLNAKNDKKGIKRRLGKKLEKLNLPSVEVMGYDYDGLFMIAGVIVLVAVLALSGSLKKTKKTRVQ